MKTPQVIWLILIFIISSAINAQEHQHNAQANIEKNKSKKEIMEIDIAKFYEKKDKLIKYLKENKNNLNLVDKLLYNYLDESLKSEIKID